MIFFFFFSSLAFVSAYAFVPIFPQHIPHFRFISPTFSTAKHITVDRVTHIYSKALPRIHVCEYVCMYTCKDIISHKHHSQTHTSVQTLLSISCQSIWCQWQNVRFHRQSIGHQNESEAEIYLLPPGPGQLSVEVQTTSKVECVWRLAEERQVDEGVEEWGSGWVSECWAWLIAEAYIHTYMCTIVRHLCKCVCGHACMTIVVGWVSLLALQGNYLLECISTYFLISEYLLFAINNNAHIHMYIHICKKRK